MSNPCLEKHLCFQKTKQKLCKIFPLNILNRWLLTQQTYTLSYKSFTDFTTTNGGALLILLLSTSLLSKCTVYINIYITDDYGWLLIQFHKLFHLPMHVLILIFQSNIKFFNFYAVFFLKKKKEKWLIFHKNLEKQ